MNIKYNWQILKYGMYYLLCRFTGKKYYPACDRDDCQYYRLNKLSYIRVKCNECLENCQRKILDGYNHYESE